MAAFVRACVRAAEPVSQAPRAGGMGVVARVMGTLQTSVAVGMVANGAHALFPGLG